MISKSCANRSHCNPESSTSITISPVPHKKRPEIQESCVGRPKTTYEDTLEKRYLALQQMYKDLLIKTSSQELSVRVQAKEIEKLRDVSDKNIKEIKKLRGMLGFLNRSDKMAETFNFDSTNPHQNETINVNTRSCLSLLKHSKTPSKSSSKLMNSLKTIEPLSENNIFISQSQIEKENRRETWRKGKGEVFEDRSEIILNRNVHGNIKKLTRCGSSSALKEKFKFVPSLNFI